MFVNKRQKIPPPRKVEPQKRVAPQRNLALGQAKATNEKQTQPKSALSTKDKKTLDWDDISLSSEDSGSFRRFLKKQDSDDEPKTAVKKEKKQPTPSFDRPKTSRGSLTALEMSKIPGGAGSSSALDRFAKIEARIKSRQQVQSISKVSLSLSDLDSDSDSRAKKSRKERKQRGDKQKTLPQKTTLKIHERLVLEDDDESSDSLNENLDPYKKFIKESSATLLEESDESTDNEFVREKALGKSSQQFLKLNVSSDLEDSDRSMREYMENLDKEKREKRPGSPKKVTFASNLVNTKESDQSLDDFLPSERSDDVSSLDDVVPSKLHNIMSLDDLLLSTEVDKDKEKSPSPTFEMAGLHSVDELIPSTDVRSSSEYAPSMEEQIQTEQSSGSSASSVNQGIMANMRSLEELSVDSGSASPATPKDSNVFHAKKPGVGSGSESEIKSESEKYSDDFNSDDDTLKGTESISQDISYVSSSSKASSVIEESLSSRVEKRDQSSSSSSFLSSYSSHSYTTSSPTPVQKKQRASSKTENIETQTDVVPGAWLPGSVYTDKSSFKPTRLINNEALDVLTSYNPATLAIQDLLQQQVELTREFVSRSRRLHDLAVTSIPCDYVYGEVDLESLNRLKKIYEVTRDGSVAT